MRLNTRTHNDTQIRVAKNSTQKYFTVTFLKRKIKIFYLKLYIQGILVNPDKIIQPKIDTGLIFPEYR